MAFSTETSHRRSRVPKSPSNEIGTPGPNCVFGIPQRAIDEAIGRTRSASGVDEEGCRAIESEEEGFGDLRGGGERRPVRPNRIEPSRGAELRGGDRGNG